LDRRFRPINICTTKEKAKVTNTVVVSIGSIMTNGDTAVEYAARSALQGIMDDKTWMRELTIVYSAYTITGIVVRNNPQNGAAI